MRAFIPVLLLHLVPACALMQHLGSRLPRLRVATTARRLAGASDDDDDMAARIADDADESAKLLEDVEKLRSELEALKRPVERPAAAPAPEVAGVSETAVIAEVGNVDDETASGGASSATSDGDVVNEVDVTPGPRPELSIDKLLSNAELFGR